MGFGHGESLVLSTYTFGVRLKHNLIDPRKRNWTPKQLVVTLLDTLNTLGAISFMIPLLRLYLRWELHNFLRMLSLGGNKVRNISFEEELVSIPKPISIVASINAHVIIPIFV